MAKGTTGVLSEYEHTLFTLYAKLSEEKWLEPQERVIFKKISLDSFNHGVMLDELKEAVEPYISDRYEEISKALEAVKAARAKVFEALNEKSRKRLFELLEELEGLEEYALNLYEKLVKKVKDSMISMAIRSILEDEKEHEEFLKALEAGSPDQALV